MNEARSTQWIWGHCMHTSTLHACASSPTHLKAFPVPARAACIVSVHVCTRTLKKRVGRFSRFWCESMHYFVPFQAVFRHKRMICVHMRMQRRAYTTRRFTYKQLLTVYSEKRSDCLDSQQTNLLLTSLIPPSTSMSNVLRYN